jgi:hypothetical protein
MADLVTKIVDCVRVRDQTVIACYRLSHDRCGNAVESDVQTGFLTTRIWTTSLRRVWSCCSLSSVETAMTYENCKLGAVQQQNGGRGFVVSNEYSRPLFSLTYATKAAAEEAHGLMAKLITGAEVTPHP